MFILELNVTNKTHTSNFELCQIEIVWVFILPLMFAAIENHALDGCSGIEKEGRFQRWKAMGRESVCDPWISDRETVSKLLSFLVQGCP
jgi:hypothetical protein